MGTAGRHRQNRAKSWNAFPWNHPLFRKLWELREQHWSWGRLERYAAEHGYPLTRGQMIYGWQKAKLSFLVFASPWVRRAAEDLVDDKFPDLEVAVASLAEEVMLINEVGILQEGAVRNYTASAPAAGEQLTSEEAAQRNGLLNTAIGLTRQRFSMQSQLLKDIADYRRLWVATVPHDVMEEIGGKAATKEAEGARRLLAVTDMDSFWRESKKLQAIMRREYMVIIDMLRRGENVPPLKPLGPGEEEYAEAAEREAEDE